MRAHARTHALTHGTARHGTARHGTARTDGRTDGRTDRRTDGRTDGRTDRKSSVAAPSCRLAVCCICGTRTRFAPAHFFLAGGPLLVCGAALGMGHDVKKIEKCRLSAPHQRQCVARGGLAWRKRRGRRCSEKKTEKIQDAPHLGVLFSDPAALIPAAIRMPTLTLCPWQPTRVELTIQAITIYDYI